MLHVATTPELTLATIIDQIMRYRAQIFFSIRLSLNEDNWSCLQNYQLSVSRGSSGDGHTSTASDVNAHRHLY